MSIILQNGSNTIHIKKKEKNQKISSMVVLTTNTNIYEICYLHSDVQFILYQSYFKSKQMIWDIIEENGFNRYFSDPNTTITTLLLDENIIT